MPKHEHAECCDVVEVHPERVQALHLPDEDDMLELAEL